MLTKGLTLKPELTAARLRELLHYDPETGVFTWIAERSGGAEPGQRAGAAHTSGYRKVCIDGRHYLEHRLVWLYVHGEFPPHQLDHIDGSRHNNALLNLRPATNEENCQNRALRSDSSTRLPGVGWHKKSGKFQARIGVGKQRKHLGLFDLPDEAYGAYLEAKARLHNFQPGARALALMSS